MAQTSDKVTQGASLPQNKPTIDPRLVWVLAISCAISVANLYYIQPLLADIKLSFGASEAAVGIVATLTQVGYALGLLLIIPLGDAFNRRSLTVIMLGIVTISLIATALAPTLLFLAIASFVLGFTTVVPQILIPFAATLAHPQERGRVVGIVMSGLLIGILLARTLSGFVAAHFGWRAIYWVAAAMMIALLFVLRFMLPTEEPHEHLSYAHLLRSMWGLIRTEPILRETSLFGGLVFGAFSAFWVTLVFFLGTPPYHFGSEVAGLFGLVGVAGALAASVVGKLSDRIQPRNITSITLTIALLSFVLLWLIGHFLWGLIIGVILLDLGTQGTQITNQTRIYSLKAELRSRLNTVYMVSYFIGGSLGSLLGAYAWNIAHWNGVCLVGCILILLALVVYTVRSRGNTRTALR
ncbi:MAG TPA: MFS transporter [Ktedonobacter sp.]|nr:MFS transporter [Ktedonobacter sp.]